MRILFYCGHPAHYHNISQVIEPLQKKGHKVLVVARDKDVLFDLLKDVPCPVRYLKGRKKGGKVSLVANILARQARMLVISLGWHPNLFVGTDPVITHVGKVLRIPSVLLNEDDADQVPLLAKYAMRYADAILSPVSCDNGTYQAKTITYQGYHELAYLHPDLFSPDRSRIEHLFSGCDQYFLLRFSALDAHHDSGISGISDTLALRLVDLLSEYGKVYITSERPLRPSLEPYRIQISPTDIHHALAYSDLYIGDSQTMTAEAAVLGVPAVRYNDFVGKLGYLEELENRYGLTFGVPAGQPDQLIHKVEELLADKQRKERWHERRQNMLRDKINVADFFTDFFERYAR